MCNLGVACDFVSWLVGEIVKTGSIYQENCSFKTLPLALICTFCSIISRICYSSFLTVTPLPDNLPGNIDYVMNADGQTFAVTTWFEKVVLVSQEEIYQVGESIATLEGLCRKWNDKH